MELRDATTFRTLFSSLVLKGSTVLENKQVEDLVECISAENPDMEAGR